MAENKEELNELLLQQIEKENITNNSNNELRQSISNKKEIKYKADTYKNIIIILAIITFIGAIILGDIYKTTSLKDYMYETTFNTQLMYICWASDFIFTLFMLLLCDILKTQEQIKEKLK